MRKTLVSLLAAAVLVMMAGCSGCSSKDNERSENMPSGHGEEPSAANNYSTVYTAEDMVEDEDVKVAFPESEKEIKEFTQGDGPQHTEFAIKSVGHEPVVINEVKTGCNCVEVKYPQEPIKPGETKTLQVTYVGEGQSPGFFRKTIKVYTNVRKMPYILRITGMMKHKKEAK